jgi:hypothetical protein
VAVKALAAAAEYSRSVIVEKFITGLIFVVLLSIINSFALLYVHPHQLLVMVCMI